MKKIIVLALVLFSILSCNYKEDRVLVKAEGEAILVVNTPTAGCRKCQKHIESALKNIDGVSQSILNLNTKKVSIVYSPETTSEAILSSTMEELKKKIPCR